MTDQNKLVESFKKANIKECENITFLSYPFPGRHYKKKYRDENIRVYIKQKECKIYVYPEWTKRK